MARLFVFIGRVLPFVFIIWAWWSANTALDRLGAREESLRQHKFLGKFYWLYGWAIGTQKRTTTVRWIIVGIGAFFLARWFFLATSVP